MFLPRVFETILGVLQEKFDKSVKPCAFLACFFRFSKKFFFSSYRLARARYARARM